MNKINGGVGVLTRPNGQDARPTEWVINIVQLLTIKALSLEVLMTLAIVAEAAPLRVNEDGVTLVGRTRVTLDTVVACLQSRRNSRGNCSSISFIEPS
jgi:hypothetical protein